MKNIIQHEGKRLFILRVLKEESKPIIDAWKEHLMADTVLRKDGRLFFCYEIKDAEILEEWTISDSEKWLQEHKKEK